MDDLMDDDCDDDPHSIRRPGETVREYWHRQSRRNREYSEPRIYRRTLRGEAGFVLSAYPEVNCKGDFRFTKAQLFELSDLLDMQSIRLPRRYTAAPETILCVVCKRLSSPGYAKDMCEMFGRDASWISSVFNAGVTQLALKYKDFLYWDRRRLTPAYLRVLAESLFPKVGISNIYGYIDGTVRKIARPSRNQRLFYNGHKKYHGLKYQGIMYPDGMMGLDGPYPGSFGDGRLVRESNIHAVWHEYFDEVPLERKLFLFGDSAYGQVDGIVGSWKTKKGEVREPLQAQVAKEMSAMREAVEWGFGDVINYWGFFDYKKGLRTGLMPIGAMYMVAVLLTNCIGCYRGNKMAQHHGLPTPGILDYLGAPQPQLPHDVEIPNMMAVNPSGDGIEPGSDAGDDSGSESDGSEGWMEV